MIAAEPATALRGKHRAGKIVAILTVLSLLSGCVVYVPYSPPPPPHYYHYWR